MNPLPDILNNMNKNEISIIWITRISSEEDCYLDEFLDKLKNINCEKIIVGHTNLSRNDFRYIPFYEFGLDEMKLICHKKNIGVLASTKKYCLVLHADTCPELSFFEAIKNISLDDQTAICPIGFMSSGQRGLTWCIYAGIHKDPDEEFHENSYIGGSCIFGSKNMFLSNPWNQNLRHADEEDVVYSKDLFVNQIKQYCNSKLIMEMKRTQ